MSSAFFVILVVLILLVCIFLGLIVLIQNPKGGGVTASLGTVSNQLLGASRSTDIVEKATWYLAGALLVLCLLSTTQLKSSNPEGTVKSETERAYQEYGGYSTPGSTFDPNAEQPITVEPAPIEEESGE